MPPTWDPLAGDYATVDGWIRLHTNAPHHREAALAVVEAPADKARVAAAVSQWRADELERAIIDQGGCAAAMRPLDAWREHPQGRSVAGEPLLWWEETNRAHARSRKVAPGRPLTGIRVLDLTRVLAGPVATRFLAGFGAEVLRIDPPWWDEPAFVPEVVLGKRCTRLDLRAPDGRERFFGLLRGADVLVHGYRPEALARLGLGVGNAPGSKARADRCLARRLRLDRTMVRPARVRQPRSNEQRHRRRGDAPFWKGPPDAPAGAGARPCDRVPDGGRSRARPDEKAHDGLRMGSADLPR